MRVLQLPSWYLPEGGQFCLHQSLALQEQGIDVYMLANVVLPWKKYGKHFFQYPFNSFFCRENGINTIRNYQWRIPKAEEINIKRWTNKTIQLFEKFVKKQGLPDIIHAHSSMWSGYAAALIKEKYGVPYVITEHRGRFSVNSKESSSLFKNFYTGYLKKAFSNADAIITVSDQLKEKVKTFCDREVPIVTISNVVDTAFFSVEKDGKKEKTDKFIFMNANSFEYAKGYDILLPAFDKVCDKYPKTLLILLGNNFDDPRFLKILNETKNKENIEFPGFQDRAGIKKYLLNSDAFVLSSRIESQSVAVLEALCCGLPVVCTHAVPAEIAKPEVSIQCPSESVENLSEAMMQLIEKYESFDKDKIVSFARSVCDKKIVGEKIINVYNAVLKR